MNRRGRPPEQVPDKDSARWAEIRQDARLKSAATLQEQVAELSGLDAVAWLAGTVEVDELLNKAVQAEFEAGASWKAIAVALGESGDADSVHRIRGRYFNRLR